MAQQSGYDDQVEIAGWVEDLGPVLDHARLMVAPLLAAHHVPVIVSAVDRLPRQEALRAAEKGAAGQGMFDHGRSPG